MTDATCEACGGLGVVKRSMGKCSACEGLGFKVLNMGCRQYVTDEPCEDCCGTKKEYEYLLCEHCQTDAIIS
ncbi:MAG: hypothetical protein IT292_03905 [Deltaproteobacteria bacterium]|nr:hypothetical protein [Deltaproteobacteria bacterium]